MNLNISRRIRSLAVLAVVCLSATTAWAYLQHGSTDIFLRGVDGYGNLYHHQGSWDTFSGVVNTNNGKFVGSALGWVPNESGRHQCYKNVDLFDRYCWDDWEEVKVQSSMGYDYSVSCSLYSVTRKGLACYVASGQVYGYGTAN